MFALGAGLLGHGLLPADDREVVIARVTARTGCSYEWGVHAAPLAQQAGLSLEQLRATTEIDTADFAWQPRHAALLDAVDARSRPDDLPRPCPGRIAGHLLGTARCLKRQRAV